MTTAVPPAIPAPPPEPVPNASAAAEVRLILAVPWTCHRVTTPGEAAAAVGWAR